MAEPPKPPKPPKPPQRPSTAARPARPSAGARQSQIDRAMALRDAVAQAVESEKTFKEKDTAGGSGGRFVAMVALLLGLGAFSAYAWIARPAFIWGSAPPLSAPRREANMRMTLFVLGMRLNKYRAAHGYYPASLEAVGEQAPGVTYELVTDSVFELRGIVGREPIVYRSDMNAREYLGNATELISNHKSR